MLKGSLPPPSRTTLDQPRFPPKELPVLDIANITATGFRIQARKKENITFQTSLYELDRLIEDKAAQDDDATLEEIRNKLPTGFQPYEDVFSKAASNVLPPHRSYDHKI
jgi:hypothetical protein